MLKRFFILQFFFITMLFSICYDPWFTGPLLAVSGNINAKGEISAQLYIYFIDTYGSYERDWSKNNYAVSRYTVISSPSLKIGLTPWMDASISTGVNISYSQGIESTQFRDSSLSFGIKLMEEEKDSLQPAVKLILKEIFPTGKYQYLDSSKSFLDATGSGSFQTVFGLNFSKIYCWFENHPIEFFVNVDYSFPYKVKINSRNIYTTFPPIGTGIVYLGNTLDFIFSFDYSITQRFALSMDFSYSYVSKTRFKGTRVIETSELIPLAPIQNPIIPAPPSLVVSQIDRREAILTLSPALEYNLNENFGFIVSFWTSITGKNVPAFYSASGAVGISF